jgi:hypothetical protein
MYGFKVSVEKGLEIVVPKRFSASRVASLVEKNSQWIERAFQKAKAFQGLIDPMPVWQMPEEITSLALDLTWRVLTRRDDMKSVVVRETSATTLVIHGATDDAAVASQAASGCVIRRLSGTRSKTRPGIFIAFNGRQIFLVLAVQVALARPLDRVRSNTKPLRSSFYAPKLPLAESARPPTDSTWRLKPSGSPQNTCRAALKS